MQFKKTTLENGLRIITVPMRDNPAVTVLVMVEAGSKYENLLNNGLSHFLEHMVFKGTPKRPKAIDISRELDAIGAQYNAFTSQEYTGYYAKADARHLDTCLDVVSDMYLNPLFDEHEMQKEKGVIVEEIRMYQDMPHRHVQDVFMNLLYGNQPAGWNIAGTESNVKSFTREDFVNYRAKHYVAEATTVVVAGAFDEASVTTKIKKLFSGISTGKKEGKPKVKEAQETPSIMVNFKETDQTHLVLGVRSFPIKSEYTPILRLLSGVLSGGMSSRLFQKLRDEMGVGYYVHADNDPYTDHGIFAVSTGVDNTRVGEVVKAILGEFKKLISIPVGDAELRKVKDYLIGSTMLSIETSDAQAQFCAYQEILKKEIKNPDEIAQEIEKVTAADIQRVAKLIFRDENLNLALIGKFKDDSALRPLLTLA
jgi:predicted Zn-dependent peptidase